IRLLLRAATDAGERLLSDDGDDGLMIELRVVEPVEHMDGTGPTRGETDADLAGELGVRGGHQAGELFVRDLHDVEALAAIPLGDPAQRPHDPVDAVAWVGEDAADIPGLETLEQVIGDGEFARHARGERMKGSSECASA